MAQAAFLEWLRKSGAYVSPKLDLFGPGEGDDRTVRAREAVDEGERLLLVPEEATLTLGRGEGAMGRCVKAGSTSSVQAARARGAGQGEAGGRRGRRLARQRRGGGGGRGAPHAAPTPQPTRPPARCVGCIARRRKQRIASRSSTPAPGAARAAAAPRVDRL